MQIKRAEQSDESTVKQCSRQCFEQQHNSTVAAPLKTHEWSEQKDNKIETEADRQNEN